MAIKWKFELERNSGRTSENKKRGVLFNLLTYIPSAKLNSVTFVLRIWISFRHATQILQQELKTALSRYLAKDKKLTAG